MRRMLALCVLLVAAPAIGQDAGSVDLVPAVEVHEVQPGDTLWDLTERVFGDPFLWPRVWSYNPEITNPHWIYPGDIVRFVPSSEPLPSQTELIAGTMEIPEESGLDDYVEEEVATGPEIELVNTVPRGAARPQRALNRFVGLFVTPKELEESGTLTNAVDDKILFAARDSVFLTFPNQKPSPGDRYMVYRTLGQVLHPKTRERWGYMTQVTGLASIESVEEEVTRARLEETVVEVERGQYVTPLRQELLGRVQPRAARTKIEGTVLAVVFDGGVVAGEHQIVFVDKGSKDGLERGNGLRVLSRGDPLTGRTEKMPYTEIARLIVVQSNETASTCLVLSSRREIEPGATVFSITQ